MNADSVWNDVQAIRSKGPLVHNITNYVVMNNTANALLAIGASPVMAHAVEEMEDLAGLTHVVGGALVINIGTLSKEWIKGMSTAMQAAAKAELPIVFDPVGAGATPYRTTTAKTLLEQTPPTVIRGNASEIMALLDDAIKTKGVDSAAGSDAAQASAQTLAQVYKTVVSVSGEIDVITDGAKEHRVRFGHAMMARVTGLGCTASALTGAFLAVNPDPLQAAAHAMVVMGIAGEIAADKAQGPGSLQMHFYDTLYNLRADDLSARFANIRV